MKITKKSKIRKEYCLEKVFFSKSIFIMSSLILFFALYYTNKNFSTPNYYPYGFEYSTLSIEDIFVLLSISFLSAFLVPRKLEAPSSLVLVVIYFFVIVPFQVMGLSGWNSYDSERYLLLYVVHICFFLCCIICRSKKQTYPERSPSPPLHWMLFALWVISAVLLVYFFKDVMSFASADTIYIQRALGKASNLFTGYLQTYNQYVLSTALVAFGLAYKKWWLLVIGIIGAVLNFTITAEKAGLTFPLFVIVLYFIVSRKREFAAASSVIGFGLAAMLLVALLLQDGSGRTDFVLWYIGTRALLIPGVFILLYQDFFSPLGYTNFSHIRGLNLFVNVPEAFVSDDRWPAIGLILGEDYLKIPTLNANANFIASDGIAGFGLPGIAIAFAVLALYLRLLDWSAAGVDKRIALPVLLPLALTLTNGSVFTVLTSFGGIFWVLVFWLFFRRKGCQSDSKLLRL